MQLKPATSFVTRAVLNEFYEHPTAAEADVWGGFSYSDGQTEAAFQRFDFFRSNHPWQTLAALLDLRNGRVIGGHGAGMQALYPSLPLLTFLALKRLERA